MNLSKNTRQNKPPLGKLLHMQDLSILYSQFKKILEKRDVWALEPFKERVFWNELSLSEKIKLAFLFLHRAEQLAIVQDTSKNEEQLFFESLELAEEIAPDQVEILCQSAFSLYHFGVVHQRGRCFLQALDKLLYAESLNKQIFENESTWRHLWGNILVALARLAKDTSFLEQALDQFALAEKVSHAQLEEKNQISSDLYWDWGEAWIRLGEYSGEKHDFERGLEKFAKSAHLGCSLPHFLIDQGEAWAAYGMLQGDVTSLEKALFYFREAILDTYLPEKTARVACLKAWIGYALAAKHLFELTHKQEHFDEATLALQEAILACPEQADLWLEWGELYLHSAWLKREVKDVETALDKLTSSKIKECNPLRVSALLGQSIVVLGLFLEDLKLLHDGARRISKALEIEPYNPDLLYSAGLAHLAEGLYFYIPEAFEKALGFFERGIEINPSYVQNWHAIFHTYLAWGLSLQDTGLVLQGIEAIKRISSLRPSSSIYLNEWGIALLRLRQMEFSEEICQAMLEEAIDKFKRAWTLNEDPETLYNWGSSLDLLGDITGIEEDYEQAIDKLIKASSLMPGAAYVRYHLALALSHLGELIGDADCLMQAVDLFESLVEANGEDSALFCDLGYSLLNLSEQVHDPVCPLRGYEYKCEAEKKLMRALELGNIEAPYHLACLYSLAGYEELSLKYLIRAERDMSLPSLEDLEHDEWLALVRNTPAFSAFIAKLKREQNG